MSKPDPAANRRGPFEEPPLAARPGWAEREDARSRVAARGDARQGAQLLVWPIIYGLAGFVAWWLAVKVF